VLAQRAHLNLVSVFDPDLHEWRVWLPRQMDQAGMRYQQQDSYLPGDERRN
jgi:hypothetical protein